MSSAFAFVELKEVLCDRVIMVVSSVAHAVFQVVLVVEDLRLVVVELRALVAIDPCVVTIE